MPRKKTTDEFVKKAKEVHGEKYDYSKVDYQGNKVKVCIACPKHGDFWQSPNHHLRSFGCPKCKNRRAISNRCSSTQDFVCKAREIHGEKYDDSKVDYVNYETKVCIVCPKHGEFWQKTYKHLAGAGCKKCSMESLFEKNRMTTQKYIGICSEIHQGKYDYSKTVYVGAHEKVCIICPIHGEFWQSAAVHMYNRSGCPKCGDYFSKTKQMQKQEDFLRRAQETHGDRYDYSKSVYRGVYEDVEIICPKHGSFWQQARHHYNGSGCPKCMSSHGEEQIRLYLSRRGLEFEEQKRLWKPLGGYSIYGIRVDFFLRYKDREYIIEFNGQQHYKEVGYFHRKKNSLEKQQRRDDIVAKWCSAHKVRLIVIRFDEIDKIEEILNTKLK